MLDAEQDRQFALSGEIGPLAVLYDIVIDSVLRIAPHEGQALDIASGSGQLVAKLALSMPRMQFLGTDLSGHMLEVARASARTYGAANVVFASQNMYELEQLAPRQFDLITWSLALHHCDRSQEALRVLQGAQRLLKPGGTFFLFDLTRPKTGRTAVAMADMFNQGFGSWFYHDSLDSYKAAFSFEELDQILAQSAWPGIRHVEPIFGNFFQMAYASSTRQRDHGHRSFLRTLPQKMDYWMLRLFFAGKIK